MRKLTQFMLTIAMVSLAARAAFVHASPPSQLASPLSGTTPSANIPTATTKAVAAPAPTVAGRAAGGATDAPEPSMIALFMLAVGGLIGGHRWHRALAKRKP